MEIFQAMTVEVLAGRSSDHAHIHVMACMRVQRTLRRNHIFFNEAGWGKDEEN